MGRGHYGVPAEEIAVSRDLNDEDEALQRAISESMEKETAKDTGAEDVEDVYVEEIVTPTATEATTETTHSVSADSCSSSPENSVDSVDDCVMVSREVEEEVVTPPAVNVEVPSASTQARDALLCLYVRELQVLASMGFTDCDVVLPLLQSHVSVVPGTSPAVHTEGMQRVVAELLTQSGVMF
jgi:hypothetical protein